MMRETADWLNRSGLILDFTAFWFAAPEFIGESRLKSWERMLAAVIKRTPTVVKAIVQGLGLVMCVLSIWGPNLRITRFIFGSSGHAVQKLTWWQVLTHMWPFCISLAIWLSLNAFWKYAIPPILSKLAKDNNARKSSFFFGAVLFMIGTILQFCATF
jgi:hypothetical protein